MQLPVVKAFEKICTKFGKRGVTFTDLKASTDCRSLITYMTAFSLLATERYEDLWVNLQSASILCKINSTASRVLAICAALAHPN